MKVLWYQGDITKEITDAIVNAANPRLLGGGGVDGCIHRAAGPQLRDRCAQLSELEPDVRCYPGEARITGGFNLPATYVIHTVGPIFPNGREPSYPGEQRFSNAQAEAILEQCLYNSLKLAAVYGLRSVAFPAISCGVYGCYVPTFARIARQVIEGRTLWGSVEEVRFVLFTETELEGFEIGWTGKFPDEGVGSEDQLV